MSTTANNKLPIVIIACQVLQSVLEDLLPVELLRNTTFMDYGLHRVPAQMALRLQDTIDRLDQPSLVVLGYGLCGNGLAGIEAGHHTLMIPKVDDCIALLLGSRQAYQREFAAEPGTYYLSQGWLESGSHPLSEYEAYAETYGAEEAGWIMDQQYANYSRLAMVAYQQSDLDRYRPQALEVARYCEQWDMRYAEILGSDRFVRRLVTAIQDMHQIDDEFVLVHPGGQIQTEFF